METKRLEAFFNDLENFLASTRELRKRVDRELASSFSVFEYISPNEPLLSRIIADLLKPNGSHGQGTLFLELFLQQLDSPLLIDWRSSLQSASVEREAYTNPLISSRSIDILITLRISDEPFVIGIENKPFAKEGKDQLSLYFDDLDVVFRQRSILTFLSKQSAPESIKKERWEKMILSGRAFDWRFNKGFQEWLSECRMRCESEKIRAFLRDFQGYVEQTIQTS